MVEEEAAPNNVFENGRSPARAVIYDPCNGCTPPPARGGSYYLSSLVRKELELRRRAKQDAMKAE